MLKPYEHRNAVACTPPRAVRVNGIGNSIVHAGMNRLVWFVFLVLSLFTTLIAYHTVFVSMSPVNNASPSCRCMCLM